MISKILFLFVFISIIIISLIIKKKNTILVVYMSCEKNKHMWNKLLKNQPSSIIFYGNPNQNKTFILKDRILSLKCSDYYDNLSMKVILMIKSILQIKQFNNITHIVKLDDKDFNTVNFNNINNINKYKKINYGCNKKIVYGNWGGYHLDKVYKNSYWYNKTYNGPWSKWCPGGSGYILSRQSLKIIDKHFNNKNIKYIYNNYIYEDVLIGYLISKYNLNLNENINFVKN